MPARHARVVTGLGVVCAILTRSLAASQAPSQGPPESVHGCLRPDVAATTARIKAAMASGAPVDEGSLEVQTQVAGCVYYTVTLASTVTITDNEVDGVSSTISGKGSITFGLAPDDAMAGYDFTSGVHGLSAPIHWDPGSALITRPNCIVTTVVTPYTLFDFWLGVTSSPVLKVGIQISPAGNDLHSIATRCKDPVGRWHDGLAGEVKQIFTPAWIVLHGEGKVPAPAPYAGQPPSMPDLQALAAAARKAAASGNPAAMTKLIDQAMPDAKVQLAAARDNFMFTAPGDCVARPSYVVRCTIKRTFTPPDRRGYGTLKTLTESTVITVAKAPPRP